MKVDVCKQGYAALASGQQLDITLVRTSKPVTVVADIVATPRPSRPPPSARRRLAWWVVWMAGVGVGIWRVMG